MAIIPAIEIMLIKSKAMKNSHFKEKHIKLINGKYYVSCSSQAGLCLPDNMTIPGDLILPEDGVYELPAHLKVLGDLDLGGTGIRSINPCLSVTGALILSGSQVKELPDNVTAGSLKLQHSELVKIGKNLTVESDLNLGGTHVRSIGSGLTVKGTLFLGASRIKKLPDGITAQKLNLENSELTALPSSLTVNSSLVLTGSKIRELGEFTSINGTLDLSNANIEKLPFDLWIGSEDASLNDRFMGRIYVENLKAEAFLILKNTPVSRLPDAMFAEGLILDGSNVNSYGIGVEVNELYMSSPLHGDPRYFDVAVIHVDGANPEAIASAISLKPHHKLIISGGSPRLPDNIRLKCPLIIKDAIMTEFPENLYVDNLLIKNSTISLFPATLDACKVKISGENSKRRFENNFHCNVLEIENTSIKNIPKSFDVQRLIVKDSPHLTLPDEFRTPGALYIENTPMRKLPENMEIAYLQIIGKAGDEKIGMPDSVAIVTESLLWEHFPYESWPENLLVMGDLELQNGNLRSLPDNFLVKGKLSLSNNPIEELPENLHVLGNLDIMNTPIKSLPASLKVSGDIYAMGSQVSREECASFAHRYYSKDAVIKWKNGKYVFIPLAGRYEIIEKKENRIKLREICAGKAFWIEKGEDKKFDKLFE